MGGMVSSTWKMLLSYDWSFLMHAWMMITSAPLVWSIRAQNWQSFLCWNWNMIKFSIHRIIFCIYFPPPSQIILNLHFLKGFRSWFTPQKTIQTDDNFAHSLKHSDHWIVFCPTSKSSSFHLEFRSTHFDQPGCLVGPCPTVPRARKKELWPKSRQGGSDKQFDRAWIMS